ncbi:diacylglycerol kinase [Acrasis kona]|uniref:Diacylglycerol kinase n=1 Tax=Acrasis kona TaxID=1008807 RepID=A0AAW2YXL4_9EUKA
MTSVFKQVGFIYNPKAAEKTFLTIVKPIIEQEFGERLYKTVATEKASGGYDSAKQLVEEGCDLVVACGGDGTNHDVVNGIMGEDGNPKCAMAVVPLGTGDDFCRSIGLSQHDVSDLTAKYQFIISTLASSGKVIDIDVGSVEPTPLSGEAKRHWFINEASFGFSADVIQAVNEQTSFWISRDFTFQFKSISMTFTYQSKTLKLRLFNDLDEQIHEEEAVNQLVAVSNGQYFGAGMQINPGALINDGVLNLCKFGDVSAWNMIWIMGNIYTGLHGEHPRVSFNKCSKLVAECQEDVYVEADGEIVGKLPATFKCNHKKLKFIVPATCLEAKYSL